MDNWFKYTVIGYRLPCNEGNEYGDGFSYPIGYTPSDDYGTGYGYGRGGHSVSCYGSVEPGDGAGEAIGCGTGDGAGDGYGDYCRYYNDYDDVQSEGWARFVKVRLLKP